MHMPTELKSHSKITIHDIKLALGEVLTSFSTNYFGIQQKI